MTTATFLQIIRIVFMLGGATITAKTGVTLEDATTAVDVVTALFGPVTAGVGTLWSLYEGIKARKAAQ